MIKELEKNIYIDYEDPNEKFSFVYIVGPLNSENNSEDFKWLYDYPMNSRQINKGQAKIELIPTSMRSRFDLYLYLKRKGWKQVSFLYDKPEFLKKWNNFHLEKIEYTVDEVLKMGGVWDTITNPIEEDMAVVVTVNRSSLSKFKQDLLEMPGYKFSWTYGNYRIDKEQELIIK